MMNFQAGGLAAVTTPVDEEEDLAEVVAADPELVTGTEEIIEEVMPDPMADLRRMATMNKDEAMARLRESRENLAARRTKQEQRAEQDRWLAFAQAMLAPTKTGAFGESVGMAAGALRDVNLQAFEQEEVLQAQEEALLDSEYRIAGDYFDALANLEGFKNTSRARVIGTVTVINEDDLEKVKRGEMKEADAERNVVSLIMQPDGTTVGRVEKSEDGTPWRVVDPRKDPSQAAEIATATDTAKASVRTQVDWAKMGFDAIPRMERLQRAWTILKTLKEDTSGLTELMRRVARFAGISEVIDDNTKLATLHSMFGSQVLQDLRALTGSKTDYEYGKVEEMNARLGGSVDENLSIIDEQMGVLGEMIDKGEFAAQQLEEGPGTQERGFWLDGYLRYRKRQAELAAEYETRTRTAPDHQIERLFQKWDEYEGNPDRQNRLIEQFREHYDIPEEVALELRKRGAAI